MEFLCSNTHPLQIATDCLVIATFSEQEYFTYSGQVLDQANQGLLQSLIQLDDLPQKLGHTLLLHKFKEAEAKRIILVGAGEKPLTLSNYLQWLNAAITAVNQTGSKDATLCIAEIPMTNFTTGQKIRLTCCAIQNKIYQYTEYKSNDKEDSHLSLSKITFLQNTPITAAEKKAIKSGKAIAEGIEVTCNLGNMPPNICNPNFLAQFAKEFARKNTQIRCEILDEKKLSTLGAGGFTAVSQGSQQTGKMIILKYLDGAKDNASNLKPIIFVGKGITFDSGGISLKPSAAMDEMKYDMCGAATVFGLFQALLTLQIKTPIIGIIAAAENMPSGQACRPGDIITTLSGQTVEILNTDAEGRLVLCDALTYAEKFSPAVVIDIATLTGACIVALGNQASGLLSNNQELADDLMTAGNQIYDRAWQLPLWEEYQQQLESPFADMANIGGKGAGTITAASFLSNFTKSYQWAHLDIAGTAWNSKGKTKGATGRPVPLLVQFLLNYEAKLTAKS